MRRIPKRPEVGFDPGEEYGDWVIVGTGSTQPSEDDYFGIQRIMDAQVAEFIPPAYWRNIKWVRRGFTVDEMRIIVLISIKEGTLPLDEPMPTEPVWTLGWKYTP